MELGKIYLYRDYKFDDGTKKDKLFIVVSYPKTIDENYLFCLTTSKEKKPYREKKQGCQSEKNNFMFFQKDDWFEKDTWVLFDSDHIKEISKKTNFKTWV